ncbi:MAG: hypothetical protein AAB295_11980, partial [Chloroflexota bacterium]
APAAPAPAQAVAAPAQAVAAPTPPPPVAAPAAPAQAVVAPSSGMPTYALPADEQAAPWARPTCSACKGRGFKLKDGKPCIVCAGVSRKEGNNPPEGFVIVVSEGIVSWQSKEDGAFSGRVRLDTSAPKAESRVDAPVAPPAPIVAAPVATPAQVLQPAAPALPPPAPSRAARAPKVAEEERGPGRPRRGFTLYFDCAVVRAPKDNTVTLTEVIATEIGPEMAKLAGKDSYYQIPFFDRRDTLAANAPQIAERLGSKDVVVNSSDQDALILAAALETYAARVVRATR